MKARFPWSSLSLSCLYIPPTPLGYTKEIQSQRTTVMIAQPFPQHVKRSSLYFNYEINQSVNDVLIPTSSKACYHDQSTPYKTVGGAKSHTFEEFRRELFKGNFSETVTSQQDSDTRSKSLFDRK